VLTGAGSAFCAGGDLAWMLAINDASRSQRLVGSRAVAEMLYCVDTVKQAVIAVTMARHSVRLGPRFLADSAFADESVRLRLPRSGSLGAGQHCSVCRAPLRCSKARRYAPSGVSFPSSEAAVWGWSTEVVPDDEWMRLWSVKVRCYLKAAPEVSRHQGADRLRRPA